MIIRPLKFFNERQAPIDTLVIHSSAFPAQEAIKTYEQAEVSPHYIVDYDGTTYQCVSEDKRAWHAGVSYWKGATDINSCSIGIEVCHRSLGQSKFNRKQIPALISLCQEIIQRHHISPARIVGHSDIAPARKADPGKDFPWKELAAHDIGIWFGSRFSGESDVEKMLHEIGYSTEDLGISAYAFCRHFLPKKIKKLSVKKIIENPHPTDCSYLLEDAEFLAALQNIYCQYQIYNNSHR